MSETGLATLSLEQNNEKTPANWVSSEEIKKSRQAKKAMRTFNMACYHLQLSASTLGWPKKVHREQPKTNKTKCRVQSF